MSSINLGTHAQMVWKAPDIDSKKTLLKEMVNMFQHKSKQAHFHKLINEEMRSARLDKLAADLTLVDTDKVIR